MNFFIDFLNSIKAQLFLINLNKDLIKFINLFNLDFNHPNFKILKFYECYFSNQ